MRRTPPVPSRRRLLASVLLAGLLAGIPLTRLSAAAHDPARSGAAAGTRVPLMLETGVRLGTSGTATTARLAALPGRSPGVVSVPLRGAGSVPPMAVEATSADRLVALGRLQLEGG
ncbi:MAG: hypothetical protein P8Z81_07235 [Deinococcales bacterium]